MEPQITIKMKMESQLQPDFVTSTPVHKKRKISKLNNFFDKTPLPEIPRLTMDNEFNILQDRKPFRELNHIEKRFNLPPSIDLIPIRKNAGVPRPIAPSTSSAPRRESNRPSFAPLVVATSDDENENATPHLSISDNLFNLSLKDILKNKTAKKIELEKIINKVNQKPSKATQRKTSSKNTVLEDVCEGEEDNIKAQNKKTVKTTVMKRNVRRQTTAGPLNKANKESGRREDLIIEERLETQNGRKRNETERKGPRARSAPVKKRNAVAVLDKPHIKEEDEGYDIFKSFKETFSADSKETRPKSETKGVEQAAGIIKFNPSSFTDAEWVIAHNENGIKLKRNFHFSNMSQGFIKITAKSSFSTLTKHHMVIHISEGRGMVHYGGVKERIITGEVLTIPLGTYFRIFNSGTKKELILSFINVISSS